MKNVSVLIPCYNSGDFIIEAVDSVLLQGDDVGEILIYDDASNSKTKRILAEIESTNSLVKVHYSTTNQGAGVARAALITQAKYPFCAFLDADDVWLPNKLRLQLESLSVPDALVCFSSYYVCNEEMDPMYLKLAIPIVTRKNLLFSNRIPTSTALFRTDKAKVINFPTLRRRQDYAFWLKLFSENPNSIAVGLSEPLIKYRKHAKSLSSSPIKNLHYNYRVFREELKFNPLVAGFFVMMNVYNRYLNNNIIDL